MIWILNIILRNKRLDEVHELFVEHIVEKTVCSNDKNVIMQNSVNLSISF